MGFKDSAFKNYADNMKRSQSQKSGLQGKSKLKGMWESWQKTKSEPEWNISIPRQEQSWNTVSYSSAL